MPFSTKEQERFLLLHGDILLNEGQSLDLLGRSAIYRGIPQKCCYQNTLIRFRSSWNTYPEFAQLVFQRYMASGVFAKIALQTTSIAHLGTVRFAKLRMPLPSLTEQRTIAGALGDVDALLGALTRLIAKKHDLKQAAMQKLLTGQTRLPGFSGEWVVRRLGDVTIDGPKNGYSGRAGPDARGTRTLRLTATTSGYLILNEESVKRLDQTIAPGSDLFLRPGDVLIQRSNTSELVGTAAAFDGPPDTYVYPDLMMRMRFSDASTARWVWRYANSHFGRRFFLSVTAGSTGSMPTISGETLRNMMPPFPPLAEQAAITSVFSDRDAEITALEQRLAKIRALKQGMMQELLTGRIRLV